MTAFLSTSQMNELRKIAELGMQTTLNLFRLTSVENATGVEETWVPNGTAQGWIFSNPTPMITVISGAQGLVNTYRLYAPVGTDIQTGDRVGVGSDMYTVSDTTAESTWLPLVSASLRKVE